MDDDFAFAIKLQANDNGIFDEELIANIINEWAYIDSRNDDQLLARALLQFSLDDLNENDHFDDDNDRSTYTDSEDDNINHFDIPINNFLDRNLDNFEASVPLVLTQDSIDKLTQINLDEATEHNLDINKELILC